MTRYRAGLGVLRWVGFSSAALISLILLLNVGPIVGSSPKPGEGQLFILLLLVPALASAILNAFNWLWPNLILGPWFILVSALIRADNKYEVWSLLLVLSSLVMFLTPVVAIALRRTLRQQVISEPRQNSGDQ